MQQTFSDLPRHAAARPLPVVRMGLLLWLLGLPGVVALVRTAPPAWLFTSAQAASDAFFNWVAIVQLGALLALAVWTGLRLGPRVGLSAPLIHALAEGRMPWRGIRVLSLPGVAAGVIGAAWLVTLAMLWPESMAFVDPAYGLPIWSKLLYGAITEELLLRFGLMTAVMWLLWKAFGPNGQRPGRFLGWLAIAIAALLASAVLVWLGAGLPGGLSKLVMFQLLACESVYGLLAGWVFWRYGLEAAMLAHVVTYLLSHGLV